MNSARCFRTQKHTWFVENMLSTHTTRKSVLGIMLSLSLSSQDGPSIVPGSSQERPRSVPQQWGSGRSVGVGGDHWSGPRKSDIAITGTTITGPKKSDTENSGPGAWLPDREAGLPGPRGRATWTAGPAPGSRGRVPGPRGRAPGPRGRAPGPRGREPGPRGRPPGPGPGPGTSQVQLPSF